MNNNRWVPVVAALVLAAAVGFFAFNAGVARGIEQSGKLVVAPGVPGVPYPYPYYGYGWHPHPWGFGFFFGPFFFVLFVFILVRAMFGRGRQRGCWHHHDGGGTAGGAAAA
jgi:hypothetical protein